MTAIPPIETEAQALALPAVAAIYAKARETPGLGSMADGNREMMSDALAAAEVKLGAYEAGILLRWMPQWEPQVVAVVAGVIRRAHEAGWSARASADDEAWGGRGPSASYEEWRDEGQEGSDGA